MIRIFSVVLLVIALMACNKYEEEEIRAIQDFTNQYLRSYDLVRYDTSSSLDIRVFISDALLPLSQVYEDHPQIFDNEYTDPNDSLLYYQLKESKRFSDLNYREFDKEHVVLDSPYSNFLNRSNLSKQGPNFTILKFSRVCFDAEFRNGIVVIEYQYGHKYGWMSGFHTAFLIKKESDQWTFVDHTKD